jgi:hypothetical protein
VGKRYCGRAVVWWTDLRGKGKGVLTVEAVHGGVGQQKGTAVVKVVHRPREPVRLTMRSTEQLRSSRRWRQG